MIEVWKNLAEIEGLEEFTDYEVSNFGKIRSLNYNHTSKVKILKPSVDRKGYLHVRLYSNGKVKTFKVHRLVALAFIDNPNNYPCVNHIDENKQNNNVNNLEFCTNEYNVNYGTRNERISKAHKGKKKSKEAIRKSAEARKKKVYCPELDKIFNSITEVANELGVSNSFISQVCKGKRKTAHGLSFEYYDK